MSSTIADTFQKKYTNKWGQALQQHSTLLQDYTTLSSNLSGSVVFFDQLGILDFEEKTTRLGQTQLDEAPALRRCVRPRMFTKAVGFDEFDATQTDAMDEIVSKTIDSMKSAAARRMDDVMIEGFLGSNYRGEEGLDKVEIPSTQTVAANFVESGTAVNSNLTVAKLRAILQKFQENEAWNEDSLAAGDKLCIAVTSSQIMALLREKELSSADYSDVKNLVNGTIGTFMGFKFIRTQRLPKVGDIRTNLAWVKSRAQFGIWDDFKVKLSIRDDMDDALQVRARFACGATRLQEEGFVKVLCDETK